MSIPKSFFLNAFITGNPFWGGKLLEITIGRVFAALKGYKRRCINSDRLRAI